MPETSYLSILVGLAGYSLNTGLRRFLAENAGRTGTEPPVEMVEQGAWALADRLTEAEIAEAVARYEDGGPSRTLARELGISKSALLCLLRERGVEIRARVGLTEVQVDEAAELYASGLRLREIAERFGVSRDCVRLALKHRGVQLRPGLGARHAPDDSCEPSIRDAASELS